MHKNTQEAKVIYYHGTESNEDYQKSLLYYHAYYDLFAGMFGSINIFSHPNKLTYCLTGAA